MDEITKENKEVAEETSPVEEAKALAKELKDLIGERKKLLEREEKLAAQRLLGGKSDAGTPVKKVDPEEEKFLERVKKLREMVGRK